MKRKGKVALIILRFSTSLIYSSTMKPKPTITFIKSIVTNGNQINAIRTRETWTHFFYKQCIIMYLLIELIKFVCNAWLINYWLSKLTNATALQQLPNRKKEREIMVVGHSFCTQCVVFALFIKLWMVTRWITFFLYMSKGQLDQEAKVISW